MSEMRFEKEEREACIADEVSEDRIMPARKPKKVEVTNKFRNVDMNVPFQYKPQKSAVLSRFAMKHPSLPESEECNMPL